MSGSFNSSYSWRYQILVLAQVGFHVGAPALRGYNKSDKPTGKHQYRLDLLADDIAGLIREIGDQRVIVAGHDWGGGIAWKVASACPELVERLIVLNAPHPAAFKRELRTLSQLRKSWYMFFFQLPYLPEVAIRAKNYAVMERAFRQDPVRQNAFASDDIAMYKAAIAEPGALTAGINYYRGNVRYILNNPRWFTEPITPPTLVIWGEQDSYQNVSLLEGLDHWVSNLRVERIPQGSHWVQIDAHERVNELMLRFIKES